MLDRRNFLLACLALLGPVSGRAGTDRQRRIDAALAENVCRSRPAEFLPAALPPRTPGELRYQGTHILTHGAFRDLAAAYRGPGGNRLVVAGGGCDDGIATVRRGTADLGGMCCPVAGSRGEGMPWLLVARDIKVVLAHPRNPAADVGLDALRDVARGKLARWRTLGGEDRAIALVVRKHCPDYFEPVRHLLLNNRPDWAPRGLFVERDEQIVDLVARFEGALGLVSWAFAKPLVDAGRLKVLSVNGVAPSAAAVHDGRYPLHGPLSVLYSKWEVATMRPFFDFLYGPQGQALIGRALVPVSADEAEYRPGRWA
ncbi:MAG: substrate-binding domain-containing protein [Pseudomonadota bacterium]